jgi:hypothetical protein
MIGYLTRSNITNNLNGWMLKEVKVLISDFGRSFIFVGYFRKCFWLGSFFIIWPLVWKDRVYHTDFNKRGNHVNTAEKLRIYIETANDNQLNDKHTVHSTKYTQYTQYIPVKFSRSSQIVKVS